LKLFKLRAKLAN